MAVTVQIRPVPDAPTDIPALLSPESTLGAYGRLRMLHRWVVNVRLRLRDPHVTRCDLPVVIDELRRLVETLSFETARMRGNIPRGGPEHALTEALMLLRLNSAGTCCEIAEEFRRDADRCGDERQAVWLTRMHAESCLRVAGKAIEHLRAALRFEEVEG